MNNQTITLSSQSQLLLQRIFSIFAHFDLGEHYLFWRFDKEKFSIFALCNDLFYWACSDLEEITLENIEIFEQAARDLKANNILSSSNLSILFACRVRNMQPQGAYFKRTHPVLNSMLVSAGPEREVDGKPFGNTPKPKELEFLPVKEEKIDIPLLEFSDINLLEKALRFFAFDDCESLFFKQSQNMIELWIDGAEMWKDDKTDYSMMATKDILAQLENIKKEYNFDYPFFAVEMLIAKQNGKSLSKD